MSLAFDKFRFSLVLLYALLALLTVAHHLACDEPYRGSFNTTNATFVFVYLLWFCLAVYHGNELIYIFQDSVGFLFYLAYAPLAFILIRFAPLSFYDSLICHIGLAVCVLHALVYGLYYFAMGTGDLAYDDLVIFNTMLSSSGFTGRLGASGGLLRIDLGLGQLLIIPLAITVKNLIKAEKIFASKSQLCVALVLIAGAILDGHRSLLITMAFALSLVVLLSVVFSQISLSRVLNFTAIMVLSTIALLSAATLLGAFDVNMLVERMSTLFAFDKDDISNEPRLEQIPALLNKIGERPLMGSGFGSHAEVLRNDLRPFMYEVDYLAVVMKLGIIGTILYVGAYVAVLMKGYKLLGRHFDRGVPYVSAGAAYLFYMGTNGGFAMSLFSTLFHVMIMLGITNSFRVGGASRDRAARLAHS
jgi:O-antigen ligase